MACLRVWMRGIVCGLSVLAVESAAACGRPLGDTGAEPQELQELPAPA